MAATRASFIPSFTSFAMSYQSAIPTVETKSFNTTRTGKDRVSNSVTIQAMHYDEVTKSIKVFGSDGHLRECRVERLPGGVEQGRQLWRELQAYGKAGTSLQFVAAGGFSPDRWFYSVR